MLPEFFSHFAVTVIIALAASLFYIKRFSKRDIAFAVVLYSALVFLIVHFVSFESNLGLGIGLLGILSLIRLRSTLDNLIDIGYVFYAITIGLLNASIAEMRTLLFADGVLTALLFFLSLGILFDTRPVSKTQIVFDDLSMERLHDSRYLKEQIKERYDIAALDVAVNKIDYLKDSVTVIVTYHA